MLPIRIGHEAAALLGVACLSTLTLLSCSRRTDPDNSAFDDPDDNGLDSEKAGSDERAADPGESDSEAPAPDTGADDTASEDDIASDDDIASEDETPGGETCYTFPTTEDCVHPEVVESCEEGWCRIPAGCFVYGSPPCQPCGDSLHTTQVQVTLTRPFLIRQTEVTQAEWEQAGFPNPSLEPHDPTRPVGFLNWYDAMAYCNALSEMEGLDTCYDLSRCSGTPGSGCPEGELWGCNENDVDVLLCEEPVRKYEDLSACPGYRLPTGAEWEYAARAGTVTSTYMGDLTVNDSDACFDEPALRSIAWYCATAEQIMPVGLKTPNRWGLYDVLGNVEEWTDFIILHLGIEEAEGESGPLVDPVGVAEYVKGQGRIYVRGKSYRTTSCVCNVTFSSLSSPDDRVVDRGFRPVRTILEKSRSFPWPF